MPKSSPQELFRAILGYQPIFHWVFAMGWQKRL
jgi:hypothetical protein